jgi:Fe-S cluster biogenesis protein NfuA
VDSDLGVAISPADRDALRGLVLEHDGARYAATLKLRVEPRETPNPESRLYEVDRPLARGRPRFFSARGDVPPLARRLMAIEGVGAVLFRDNAVSIQREPGLGWAALDRAVDAALREHFLMCGDAIPEPPPLAAREGLHRRVAQVVADRIAPGVHADGGDIEIIDVKDGVVHVHLIGACERCPASDVTLKLAVERTLREAFPGEVDRVVSI